MMLTESFFVWVRRIWSNYFFSSLFPVASDSKCATQNFNEIETAKKVTESEWLLHNLSVSSAVSAGNFQIAEWASNMHWISCWLTPNRSALLIDFLCCKMIRCRCVFALTDENLNIFKSICGWYLKQSTFEPHTYSKTTKPDAFNIIETLYLFRQTNLTRRSFHI